MARFIILVGVLVAAPVAAQQVASELTAQQIGDVVGTNTIDVDPLHVEQPPATAQDTCGTPLSGCDSRTSVLLDEDASPSASVEVREDGVYLKLETGSDDTYDPDKIAQRLESDDTPSATDWGVGGVAQQVPGVRSEPESAPVVMEGIVDPATLPSAN